MQSRNEHMQIKETFVELCTQYGNFNSNFMREKK